MRPAFQGLTTRGRSFIAAALAAGVSAFVLGERDLLRVAILLLALPLLAAVYVAQSRYRLSCARTLGPDRVTVGGRSRVELRLTNLSRLPTGTLMLEDRLPYALGSRPRLVLERMAGQRSSAVAYTLRAEARGRYEVGPLTVRVADPFGLCEIGRSFASLATLTVVPQVVSLPAIRLAGEFSGRGDSTARSVAVHGEDDIAIREYRHGDDLRRVHWRATAHRGELMVRREEQPWESQATIVLDTRRAGHQGEGPTSSFEWAVSAVASIAVHLHHAGYRLRMVAAGESIIDIDSTDRDGEGPLLDSLATVAPIGPGSLADIPAMTELVRHRTSGGLIIAVLGGLTVPDAETLGRLRTAGTTCIGLLLDPTTWRTLPDEARAEADARHEATARALASAGWRVIEVRHGDSLAALWPRAGRGAQGFATRATLAETVAP